MVARWTLVVVLININIAVAFHPAHGFNLPQPCFGRRTTFPSTASVALVSNRSVVQLPTVALSLSDDATTESTKTTVEKEDETGNDEKLERNVKSIQENLAILTRAAETRQEPPAAVYEALTVLEKQMRQQAKNDFPATAQTTLYNLHGDWQLVFTSGTKKTQERFGGTINYFPIKAVQSFRTRKQDSNSNSNNDSPSNGLAEPPYKIENGIYIGDYAVFNFGGSFSFDLRRRVLEFEFNRIELFNKSVGFDIKPQDVAAIGKTSGLASDAAADNFKTGKKLPFFNWISADDKIAAARGGSGGVAVWKRIG